MSDKIVLPDVDSIEEEVDVPGSYVTAEDLADISQEIELEQKYGDRPTEAAALGAASGLTFGLSNKLLQKLGYSQEELREIDDRNKAASITGEIAGVAGSLLNPVGVTGRVLGTAGAGVKAVTKAGQAAEQITAKTLNKLIAETGERKFAKDVIKKAIPKAAGSSVEGAAFGTGQLVKEDALGTSDFNAENLITAAGGGALIGGALGAGIGGAIPLFAPAAKVGKKVKDAAAKRVAGLTDAEDAAMDLLGFTTTQKYNAKKFQPQLVQDLPDFLVNSGGMRKFSSTDDLYNNLLKLKDESGAKIPALLQQIDDAAISNPALLPDKKQVFDPLLEMLDDKYIKVYGGKKAFKDQLGKVRQIRDDIRNVRFGDQPLTAGFLQELRKQADDLAKFQKQPGTVSMGEQAARDVRRALRTEIDNLAERASLTDPALQGIAAELRKANKAFSTISQIEKPLGKKVNQPQRIASLTDLVAGDIAADVGMEAAVGTIGIKKLLESDFRRRLAVLSHVEKQNQKVQSQVSKSVKNFFKSAQKPVETTTKNILIKSSIATKLEDNKEKKPKNKQEAFRNIKENITELATNPEKLEQRLIRSTAGLSRVAPETASSAQQLLVRSVQFLMQKMPKEVYSMEGLSALKRERQISDLELSKFTRYLEAVENPLVLLDDLQSGTATREQVEAVSVVYPDLYQRIVSETYEYLASEPELAYNKKVQIGTLLNIDADSSLRKDALMDLQQRFRAEEDAQEQQIAESRRAASTFTPERARSLNKADRMKTENQEAQEGIK